MPNITSEFPATNVVPGTGFTWPIFINITAPSSIAYYTVKLFADVTQSTQPWVSFVSGTIVWIGANWFWVQDNGYTTSALTVH